MVLTEHGGYLFGSNVVLSLRDVRYGLALPGTYPGRRVFAELLPGHRLTIDAIRDEMAGDAYEIVVYGRTRFPPTGKEVTFAYDYPGVPPFPWEPTSATPE